MNTFTMNVDFPPRGAQVVHRSGTLLGVVVPQPSLGMPAANGAPAGNVGTGTVHLSVTFYDTASGSLNTPICTVDTKDGYSGQTMSIPFTTGLYALASSPSAIEVFYQ